MGTPIRSEITSILMTQDTDTAADEGTPRQITASAVGSNYVTSADLTATNNYAYQWHVLEALDGDCKKQKVLITSFNENTDNIICSPFWKTSPTSRQFKHWSYKWPLATATSAGTTTTAISNIRTEADNYWKQYQMLSIKGANTDLKPITNFTAGTDTFLFDAMTANTAVGDALMPVQSIQPSGVTISVSPGTAIERGIITDSGDPEGIVIGAQDDVRVTMSPEVRGLLTPCIDGVTADSPDEIHVALDSVFTRTITTGDSMGSSSNATTITVQTPSRFSQYAMGLINGDAFAITAISGSDLTVPSGHISSTPALNDVLYGGASYKPMDSGHKAVSFISWFDDVEMMAITGAMPSVSVDIQAGQIAKYNFEYMGMGGFMATYARPYDDIYSTALPVVGLSNVSRIVLDGTELEADVVSARFNLLPAPTKKTTAFGGYENCGGYFYGKRQAEVTLVIAMEDSSYFNRYRAADEMDFLLQCGSVGGNAWAFWAGRSQIVALSHGESDKQRQWTVTLRFLRPTTQGQPAFTFAHF